jgi:hypothetical protein
MADGSLGGLGSSIGLTATAKDYSNLYRYNQQAKAQKAKAKDDKLDEIIKLVTVKSSESKLHPLEVGSMEIRTGQFVQNVRRMAAEDDIRGIDNEVTSMFADLNEAQNRSSDYWGLEKTVKEAAAGNKYVPKNVRQAARIMVGSASSADFITALNDNQVRRNDFLDYDDNGRVVTQSFDYYDIDKSVKDLIAGNSVVIGVAKEPYTDPNTKTTFFPRVMGIPIDDEEAKRVSNMVDANGNLVRPMLTAKKISKTLLSNTSLAAQYIDQYDLEDKTPEEIEQHFYENMVEPNVKRKETIQTAKPPSSLTINNQPGTPGDYTFEGGPATKLIFAYSMSKEWQIANPGKTKFTFTVDSPYSVSLAVGGSTSFRLQPSKNFINKATGKSMESPSTQPIDINNVSVLPYEIKDGVKIIIGDERVQALKTQGKKVPYSAFVEGKGQLIGVEGELTNADFYTEFTSNIRSNIANQSSVLGSKAKAALVKGFLKLDKEIAAANK